MTETSVAKNV